MFPKKGLLLLLLFFSHFQVTLRDRVFRLMRHRDSWYGRPRRQGLVELAEQEGEERGNLDVNRKVEAEVLDV